jgi:hypothetical protein
MRSLTRKFCVTRKRYLKNHPLALCLGLISTLCSVAFAAPIKPHQALIDVNYVESDEAGKGQFYRMQLPVKEGVYVVGSRTQWESDENVEQVQKLVGGGFYWETLTGARMYLGYSKVDFSQGAIEEKDMTQYSLGWRGRTSREMEWVVEVNRTDFKTEGVDKEGYVAGLHYYLSDTFAITAETRRWREQDALFLGFRLTSGH